MFENPLLLISPLYYLPCHQDLRPDEPLNSDHYQMLVQQVDISMCNPKPRNQDRSADQKMIVHFQNFVCRPSRYPQTNCLNGNTNHLPRQ